MEVYGSIWKYMKIYDGILGYMDVYLRIYKYMRRSGCIWGYRADGNEGAAVAGELMLSKLQQPWMYEN